MHLDFFELQDNPFRLTPDSRYLYLGKGHARAKAYMEYTIWNRDSFVVITGEIGAGKTTLIKTLLSELDDRVVVAKVYQTQLDEIEFLQAILVEFGYSPYQAKKVELLNMLNMFLIEQYSNGRKVVLIIDEAQNLGKRVLEEVRLLSGMETQQEKLLNVILAGQPELNDILDGPDMEQLRQRIRLRFHLRALTESETIAYILHRVTIAGSRRPDLFDHDAMSLVFRYSGGIPRLINTLCDTAMVCAYVDGIPRIDATVIRTAIDELQWKPRVQGAAGSGSGRGVPPSSGGEEEGDAVQSASLLGREFERISGEVDAEIRRMEEQLAQVSRQLGLD